MHRRDDGRVGLIHPPWVALPDVSVDVLYLRWDGDYGLIEPD